MMKSFGSMVAKSNCIQLHRFVRLGDKSDSQVFTFIVPTQLTRGFINTALSKEFPYGGQSWQFLLSLDQPEIPKRAPKEESSANGVENEVQAGVSKMINVGLTLCGGLAGMHCELDLIRYTVLNRASVQNNLSYEERHVSFTADDPVRWKNSWIGAERLSSEHFYFDDWTWLIEVELQGASTTYEESFAIPRNHQKDLTGGLKLESASFTFAGSDWNVILTWPMTDNKKHSITAFMRQGRGPGENSGNPGCPRVKLQRHSRTNHWCRVRFKVTLEWGSVGEASIGPVDNLITADNGATTTGCEIGDIKWFNNWQFAAKQRVRIIVEMLAAAPVSRIDLIPIAPQGGKNFARCKDPEGHDWMVLSDILGTLVRLRFFPVVEIYHYDGLDGFGGALSGAFKDGIHRPDRPSELRCVAWNAHLIPHDTSKGVVKALNSPYVSYIPTFRYSVGNSSLARRASEDLSSDTQQMIIHPEEVTEVALDLPVEKVIDKASGYIRPDDNAMTIRIEWLQSQRLYQSNYNVYDDLVHTQKKQLARELRALQLENYSLEKQLYINNAPSASIELSVPESHGSSRSQSMKHLNAAVTPSTPSSPEPSPVRHRSNTQKQASGRRLPDASLVPSVKNCSYLSTDTISNLNIRRHSSALGGLAESQGRPRRSLPSPGLVSSIGVPHGASSSSAGASWRHQKRFMGVDEDFSEGYKSREDSPVQTRLQVDVNGSGSTSGTNLSSPTRSQQGHWRSTRKTQHELRPHTANSSSSSLNNNLSGSRGLQHRSLTPTLVFSLSSEDSVSGSGAASGF